MRTKEQADHSLPYLIAVALLDGQVMPEQYAPERIERKDVQQEAETWPGSVQTPMDWSAALAKFESLAEAFIPPGPRSRIAAIVADLDRHSVTELMAALAEAGQSFRAPAALLKMRRN